MTSARILIVDDEPANVRLLERVLATGGYTQLTSTTDARTVLDLFRTTEPDLVILDLMMPYVNGIDILRQLRTDCPGSETVPVLVLTADATPEAKRRALDAGARDFLTKPFSPFEALLRIRNLIDMRHMYLALEAHNRSLEDTVRERSAQLLQSEKVAAMGSLLAGVAHELNNPLAILSGHAQLLLEDNHPAVADSAQQIQQAADRCVRIVRNFLALARQRPPERAKTDVKRVLAESLELLAYELRTDNVAVAVDVPDDLPVLWADAHQLHQVFVNLLTNAHHALKRMPSARRIGVRARHDRDARLLRLEIADTGPGIPEDVRGRIFDPFFTTKPVGEGTGLGLSLCRGIVEEHGGTITVDSAPGHGATLHITLPVTPPPSVTAAAASAPAAPARAPRHVLVVDDEPAVADVISKALARDGHTAHIASHGGVALDMLGRGHYDVVVSDTKMPEMDGEAFYDELSRRFPALRSRIIFVTGDVLSREKREFIERTHAPFLTKPCDLGELRRLVDSL